MGVRNWTQAFRAQCSLFPSLPPQPFSAPSTPALLFSQHFEPPAGGKSLERSVPRPENTAMSCWTFAPPSMCGHRKYGFRSTGSEVPGPGLNLSSVLYRPRGLGLVTELSLVPRLLYAGTIAVLAFLCSNGYVSYHCVSLR